MSLMKFAKNLAAGEEVGGAGALEWALILGLVIIAAVGVVATIGTRASATWTSVSDGLEPAARHTPDTGR